MTEKQHRLPVRITRSTVINVGDLIIQRAKGIDFVYYVLSKQIKKIEECKYVEYTIKSLNPERKMYISHSQLIDINAKVISGKYHNP